MTKWRGWKSELEWRESPSSEHIMFFKLNIRRRGWGFRRGVSPFTPLSISRPSPQRGLRYPVRRPNDQLHELLSRVIFTVSDRWQIRKELSNANCNLATLKKGMHECTAGCVASFFLAILLEPHSGVRTGITYMSSSCTSPQRYQLVFEMRTMRQRYLPNCLTHLELKIGLLWWICYDSSLIKFLQQPGRSKMKDSC